MALSMPRPTVTLSRVGGNLLFERAVGALGFDMTLMSRILGEVLLRSGTTPMRASPDDVGFVLPEIERRMLLLAPHERVAPGLARLRRLLMSWDARSS
jgi:hypothetical protein